MVEKIKKHETIKKEAMAQRELETFIDNPGLGEMAALFGVEELPAAPNERLLVLQRVAATNWDFRKGAERQATVWDNDFLDKEGSSQWNAVFSAADKLGLVRNTSPSNKNPNSLIILGGANRAPLDRLRYGLANVDDFDNLTYLGSSRPVSDQERENAKDYAPTASTEAELGSGAFETLLGARLVDEINTVRDGDVWGMRLYEFDRNGERKHGFVLSTPQQIGARRATTYDNLTFFADRAELSESPDYTAVIATTGFFTAFQHLSAVQELTLKYGTNVETIGHSAEYSGGKRKPSQLLQETKSAIDAAVRLQQAISASEKQ